jgi:hypothetical protein
MKFRVAIPSILLLLSMSLLTHGQDSLGSLTFHGDNLVTATTTDVVLDDGVYYATIADEFGELTDGLAWFERSSSSLLVVTDSGSIPNDGTPLLLTIVGNGSGRGDSNFFLTTGDPPDYPGTPHLPTKEREVYDTTKIPVFRGGSTFDPKQGEYDVDKDGNVKINTKGVSVNTNPDDPNVKNRTPYQITELPAGLEVVQQGKTKDGGLKTHGVIRPTRPMKPDEYKKLLGQIKTRKYEPPKKGE